MVFWQQLYSSRTVPVLQRHMPKHVNQHVFSCLFSSSGKSESGCFSHPMYSFFASIPGHLPFYFPSRNQFLCRANFGLYHCNHLQFWKVRQLRWVSILEARLQFQCRCQESLNTVLMSSKQFIVIHRTLAPLSYFLRSKTLYLKHLRPKCPENFPAHFHIHTTYSRQENTTRFRPCFHHLMYALFRPFCMYWKWAFFDSFPFWFSAISPNNNQVFLHVVSGILPTFTLYATVCLSARPSSVKMSSFLFELFFNYLLQSLLLVTLYLRTWSLNLLTSLDRYALQITSTSSFATTIVVNIISVTPCNAIQRGLEAKGHTCYLRYFH